MIGLPVSTREKKWLIRRSVTAWSEMGWSHEAIAMELRWWLAGEWPQLHAYSLAYLAALQTAEPLDLTKAQ